jgi:hypothetical protein
LAASSTTATGLYVWSVDGKSSDLAIQSHHNSRVQESTLIKQLKQLQPQPLLHRYVNCDNHKNTFDLQNKVEKNNRHHHITVATFRSCHICNSYVCIVKTENFKQNICKNKTWHIWSNWRIMPARVLTMLYMYFYHSHVDTSKLRMPCTLWKLWVLQKV